MKHPELYTKYKTNYPPLVNPLFSKRNWWRIGLITVLVVLIGPLIIYKHQRSVPFTFDYYLKLIEYFSIIVVPFVGFLFLVNWQESRKRSRGYGWVGKFEVIKKQSSFLFCYLLLAPGDCNRLKVKRDLFEKIRVGDFIQVRRDALGKIEEVTRIKKFSSRLAKAGTMGFPKSSSQSFQSENLKGNTTSSSNE